MTDQPAIDPRLLVRFPDEEQLRLSMEHSFRREILDISQAMNVPWSMLDRAAMWVSSVFTAAAQRSDAPMLESRNLFLPVLANRVRAVASLGRSGLEHLPSATATARTVLESALRMRWILDAPDERTVVMRTLALHRDQVTWKQKVARDLDQTGGDGGRWTASATRQSDALAARCKVLTQEVDDLPRAPTLQNQLRDLDLIRLYHGYRLASEYAHGGLTGAIEAHPYEAALTPYGPYWPSEWYLATSMCAWGCALITGAADHRFDLGPIRGAILASDIVAIAPGPEETG